MLRFAMLAMLAMLAIVAAMPIASCGTKESANVEDASAPSCEASSAERGPSGFPTRDALPSGACAAGTAECSMAAELTCACKELQGPVNVYRCRCEGGAWTCEVSSQGAASCGVCPSDASSD